MKNFILRFVSTLIITPIFLFALYDASYFFYFLLLLILSLSFYEIIKNIKQKKIFFFLALIICFFVFSLIEVRGSDYRSYILLVWILLIVWLSDTFGYLVGNIFGGPKLSIYSPNKTISGLIGSVFFSQLSIIFPIMLLDNFIISIKIFLIQFILCVISVFGDIFFSKIKRINYIKDYSEIIPGHGGVLDRIDGMIFVVIAYYFINLHNVI